MILNYTFQVSKFVWLAANSMLEWSVNYFDLQINFETSRATKIQTFEFLKSGTRELTGIRCGSPSSNLEPKFWDVRLCVQAGGLNVFGELDRSVQLYQCYVVVHCCCGVFWVLYPTLDVVFLCEKVRFVEVYSPQQHLDRWLANGHIRYMCQDYNRLVLIKCICSNLNWWFIYHALSYVIPQKNSIVHIVSLTRADLPWSLWRMSFRVPPFPRGPK